MQTNWDKARLEGYIGFSESARLEFKSAKLLYSKDGKQDPEKITRDLTKEISALANEEGGEIILGMEERKEGKIRVADKLEGFDEKVMPRERLQHLVEGNLRPPLTGLRFLYIKLDSGHPEQVACVIEVPKGNTAYQASDFIYYGRSEYEVKTLHDRDVRLRMNRGRVPLLECRLERILPVSPEDRPAAYEVLCKVLEILRDPSRTADMPPYDLEKLRGLSHKDIFDSADPAFEFKLAVENIGEISAPDYLCELRFTSDARIKLYSERKRKTAPHLERGFYYDYNKGDPFQKWRFESCDCAVQNVSSAHRLFPGAQAVLGGHHTWYLEVPDRVGLVDGLVQVSWKIYVDDAMPMFGEIDLLREIKEAMDFSAGASELKPG